MNARTTIGVVATLLGVGIGLNSLLGPLVLGQIEYRTSSSGASQLLGADIATLVVVAPVSIAAGVLWLRGHWLAPLAGLAAGAYAAYLFAQVIIGIDYALYEGNSERYFPLHLALAVGGGVTAVYAWSTLDTTQMRPLSPRLRRIAAAAFLVGAAFLVLGLHLPSLLPVLRGEPTAEYLEIPAAFWAVKLMDLGIITPIALATGVGLLRGSSLAIKAAYGVSGWFTVLAVAVAAMSAVMQWNDEPDASAVFTAVFALLGVAFAVLTARLVWSARP